VLRFVHSRFNIFKKFYRICDCSFIETELHLFFYCNLHDATRSIVCNKVCNILTDNKSAEHFDCLSTVELLRLLLVGLFDAPTQISVAVFCAVDEFLTSCDRF